MNTESVSVTRKLDANETGRRLSSIQRAVLLAVVYGDLFDFALTFKELCERLVEERADDDHVRVALKGAGVVMRDGHVVLPGREHLVELRQERMKTAAALWPIARRYARWLSRLPFVRMVAVSGSLAVNNARPTGDVDVFCITEENRLWVARLFLVALSKLTRRLPRFFPSYLCPNYLLERNALQIDDRNLFTAHEIVQAVPLYGHGLFREFRLQNAWVADLLPNTPSIDHIEPEASTSSRVLERLLGGRVGDAINEASYLSFTWFYRYRARRREWDWSRLEPAYGRRRYVVPEGGYVSVVGRLFCRRIRQSAGMTETEISRLFPESAGDVAVFDWAALFDREYGHV